MLERLSARVIAYIAAAVLAVVIVWAAFHFWQKSRSQAAQSRVTTGQVHASTASGAVAVNTVGGVMSNDASTDAQVAAGQGSIGAAPEGQKGKVSRKVACGFKSAADRPECKEPAK